MGDVYRARDPRMDRDVALKVIKAELTDDVVSRHRFESETRKIAAISHPNICTVHDAGEHQGEPFLVMELLEGPTLATRLAANPQGLPIDQALSIAAQLADAVGYAHRRLIIHRDIKPANVMLTPQGVKLLDFGVAQLLRRDQGDGSDRTQTLLTVDQAAGTLPYMAPEQIDGRADERSDIFALGAVLLEMLTGRRAFEGSTASAIIAAIAKQDPLAEGALRPDIPADLQRVVRRCLAKDPDQRWQSATDLADELRWLATPRPAGPETGAESNRWRTAVLATVAAAIGAVVSWGLLTSPRQAPNDTLSFEIPPPEGVTWTELPPEPFPAVSPDGQRVAFAGDSKSGRGLWIRDLADTTARLLPGSTDLGGPDSGPFWSSDSKRLGYCVRQRRLILHSFDGQPPIQLDANCTSGIASWNEAGQILFRGEDGLFLVSARGGPATRVTTIDPSQELMHAFPRWLPDNRRFLYTVVGATADASGIYVGSLDGSKPKRVLADFSKTEYVVAPDGRSHLLFVRNQRLLAQPIDLATLTATGDPRVLADRMSVGNAGLPSFSASPTLLVHRSGGASAATSWEWVDREGRPTGVRHDELGTAWSTLSPNGAIWLTTQIGGGLRLIDYARRDERVIVDTSLPVMLPAFAKSGRRIAFSSVVASVRRLYVMDFPNGTPKEVAISPSLGLIAPQWSVDEQMLIGTDHIGRIVAVSLDKPGEPVALVERGNQAQLSPDGRWLAYTALVNTTPQVFVQRFPGNGGDRRGVSTQGGLQPQWSGDGRELFYVTPNGDLMSLSVRTSPEFETGATTMLFRAPLFRLGATPFDQSFLPAPDGKRFLVHLRRGDPVPLTAVRHWLTTTTPERR